MIMTETKKCDIWVSSGNPCKIHCSTCNKTFAQLSMPMTTDVLKSVCDAYKQRCARTLTHEEMIEEAARRENEAG